MVFPVAHAGLADYKPTLACEFLSDDGDLESHTVKTTDADYQGPTWCETKCSIKLVPSHSVEDALLHNWSKLLTKIETRGCMSTSSGYLGQVSSKVRLHTK